MCAEVTRNALTAEDVRILGLETARVAGHTLKVMVLDPGAELGADELREWVAARIGRLPRLRQRLELQPDSGPPTWVPDRDFDLTQRVRRAEGAGTLPAAVARIMERRLDRRAPLWSIELTDGGEDGSAVVLKVHHALADGMGARRIASVLLWDEEEPRPVPSSRAAPPPPDPPEPLRRRLVDFRNVVGVLERELAPAASRSPLAQRVGPARVVALASVALAELEPLKSAFATRVTINDLVLAATAGGLRRWLEHRHAALHAMRVKVPVSLHRPGEPQEALGNADSFFFVDLPVTEPDPERRLLEIARECWARKRAGDAQQLDAFLGEIAAHSPSAGRAAVHWSMSPRVFTLNVSNVPGPRQSIRVCGRPLRAVYSLAEVADWHALRIAVFSAGGTLTFGLCGDAEHVTELDTLAHEIEAEFAALTALTRDEPTV
jgi:diacylglycerol O-acyltransferase / wax synthase